MSGQAPADEPGFLGYGMGETEARIKLIPARFVVIRHVRPKLAGAGRDVRNGPDAARRPLSGRAVRVFVHGFVHRAQGHGDFSYDPDPNFCFDHKLCALTLVMTLPDVPTLSIRLKYSRRL